MSKCFFIALLKWAISQKKKKKGEIELGKTNHNCIKAIHLSLHKNIFEKSPCIIILQVKNISTEIKFLFIALDPI